MMTRSRSWSVTSAHVQSVVILKIFFELLCFRVSRFVSCPKRGGRKILGQEASPSKCVLLSTSGAARRRMRAWRKENEGCFWAVELDVRDLGGHLDVTLRAVAGTLSGRVKTATTQINVVGALLIGMACSNHLPRGFMVAKVLPCQSVHLVAFMTNTPALLSLQDGPCGIAFDSFDDILHTGRMKERIFRPLDFASTVSPGHGPIHLLVESAPEIGLYWDSDQAGWIRPGLLEISH